MHQTFDLQYSGRVGNMCVLSRGLVVLTEIPLHKVSDQVQKFLVALSGIHRLRLTSN